MDDLGCIDEDTRVSIATPPEFSFNVTVFVKPVFGMHRWKAPGLSGHLLSLSSDVDTFPVQAVDLGRIQFSLMLVLGFLTASWPPIALP